MRRYSAYGLTIASEFALPDVPSAEGNADVTIRRGTVSREKGPAGLRSEVRRFRDVGTFRISEGREIVVDPLDEDQLTRIGVILLGAAMAYLLRQRGWFPLHGSGVTVSNRTILFLGDSGVGKSTTAAAFFASGHKVVSDDVCPVRMVDGRCWLQPSQPRVRLTAESRGLLDAMGIEGEFRVDKHTYQVGPPSDGRSLAQVDRIYILEPGDAVGVRPATPVEAVTLLSANSFTARREMAHESLRVHVGDCAAVASAVPVAHLVRSSSLEDVKTIVRVVLENL